MKIIYPYMNNSYIVIKNLLEGLGNEVIVPPKPSKRTISYGTQYSPEFACFPFKVLLGTYIEGLKLGADTIVSSGGIGPCRAGLYTTLQEKILKSIGYDFEMITLEPPSRYFKDLMKNIKKLTNKKISPNKIISLFNFVWNQLKLLDMAEEQSFEVRPIEINRGDTTKVYQDVVNKIANTSSYRELKKLKTEIPLIYKEIKKDKNYEPIKIGIVGEIYVVLEPTANYEIEETLGELGVKVERSMFVSHYTITNALMDFFHLAGERNVKKAAFPYFNEMCGGHGRESIGNAIIYAKKGYDGLIQLAPFTCIPEIVAKSILPNVSKKYDLPFLSLSIDEQTGKAGLQTRLEAFVDLLKRKRERKKGY